ncbi:hypothetical protein HanPI659440_Chr03g0104861 [Helianthus annuus]|nr:hypothetical protein HanPI659440_Chr03g0104861 [Helianthus annuus]
MVILHMGICLFGELLDLMGWDHKFYGLMGMVDWFGFGLVLSDLELFTRVLVSFMLLVICKTGQIYDDLSSFENDLIVWLKF